MDGKGVDWTHASGSRVVHVREAEDFAVVGCEAALVFAHDVRSGFYHAYSSISACAS